MRACTHLSNPSDILVPIFLAKPKILVQPKANVIAIEAVGGEPPAQKLLLERIGDGGFTGGGEASEPERETLLIAEGRPLFVGYGRGMPGYVAGFLT